MAIKHQHRQSLVHLPTKQRLRPGILFICQRVQQEKTDMDAGSRGILGVIIRFEDERRKHRRWQRHFPAFEDP